MGSFLVKIRHFSHFALLLLVFLERATATLDAPCAFSDQKQQKHPKSEKNAMEPFLFLLFVRHLFSRAKAERANNKNQQKKHKLGAFVGAFVGTLEGALVGAFVGTFDGAFVGALVGTLAAQRERTHTSNKRAEIAMFCVPIKFFCFQNAPTTRIASREGESSSKKSRENRTWRVRRNIRGRIRGHVGCKRAEKEHTRQKNVRKLNRRTV